MAFFLTEPFAEVDDGRGDLIENFVDRVEDPHAAIRLREQAAPVGEASATTARAPSATTPMRCRRANMIDPSGRSTGFPWQPWTGTRHAAVRLM